MALKQSAIDQIETLLAEKAARSPAQRKIASTLLYEKTGRFKAAQKTSDGEVKSLTKIDDRGRALVDIKFAAGADLRGRVESLGGTVVNSSSAHSSARAWVGLDRLEDLASDSAVRAVRPALQADTKIESPRANPKLATSHADRVAAVQRYLQSAASRPTLPPAATAVGAADSEGSRAMGADRARKFYNVDGTGVRIGVLSDSDDFKEQSIATGDLPVDTVTVPGQDGRPGAGEGTAMMQIVHDVAPGAKLFFATAFNSPESFAENIRTLRFTYHCDIIVDDIIYFFESPFQDDIIAQAVEDIIADGGMYFSSAGNEGNFNDGTSGTWEGDFKAAGTLSSLPSGYTVHDFGNRVISNRIEASGGPLILHWSDPATLDLPASSNDYDIFVLDGDLRNVVVAGTDIQDGDDLPFEFLGFNIPPGFRVVIAKNPGAKVRALRMEHFRGEMGIATSGASYGHNSAANAFGVAAVDWFEAGDGEFRAGPTTPVELFSGDGDRRVFYKRDNTPIGGGVTFASGGGTLRKKPDLAGADGVSTTLPPFSGLNPFFGTSAAAPHAAAIAGLVKSAVPNLSTAKIRKALVDGALDIEAEGVDRDSGAGIVQALNSLREAGAKAAVFLDLGEVSVTPTSGDVLVPGGSGTVSVELINNGGATATAISATLSSTTPGVTVSPANSTYPSLHPGESATNNTPFGFAISSSVPCGTAIGFRLVVTFNGRGTSPRVMTFSAQTGRPSTEATAFAYTGAPVAIPDDDAAGVDVPLSVSFPGAVSTVTFSIDGTSCSAAVGSTTVGVDHTFVSDLTFSLTSPTGTSVTIIDGAGGSGNNFCQTVLDDSAVSSIEDVFSGQNPFTGTFAPNSPLAAFSGSAATGTWTLHVNDNFAIDTGSVRAFTVNVSGFSCTP